MLSPTEELIVAGNILAQSPKGLDDPEFIGKFFKAKFQLHAMTSMDAMQAQMPPPPIAQPQDIAPTASNEALGATNAVQPDQSTTSIPPMQNG